MAPPNRAWVFAFLLVGCTTFSGETADAVGGPTADTPRGSAAGGEGQGAAPGTGEPGAPGAAGSSKPALAPSCARVHGGQTCGPNGDEDCCASVPQGQYRIDRFMVTAGRMRTFIDKQEGNVRAYVMGLPPDKWKPAWTDAEALPTDRASANAMLGPAGKKACTQGSYTGHTFHTPPTDEDHSDFDQDTLDEKALNCVPWAMLQAFCAWDGGHLATLAELKAAFTNDGTTKFPWGNQPLSAADRPDPEERLNLEGGYETPKLPATYRKGDDGKPIEVSFRIAPPGRFPKGDNKAGVADAAGNLLEWVGDQPRRFVWKGDFEHHAANAQTFAGSIWWEARANSPLGVGSGPWIWGEGQLYGNAGNAGERHGYYSIGGRCAR